MRDKSEMARRGVLQSGAKRRRRTGSGGRTAFRATPCLTPLPPIQNQAVYWHGELPPFDAEAMGEHVVEARSKRVPSTLAQREELWHSCYGDLMAQARIRLEQEIIRLGGDYAHVLNESVDSRHDDATGESWLQGRFSYILYRQPTS